jgi:hypothetical protein
LKVLHAPPDRLVREDDCEIVHEDDSRLPSLAAKGVVMTKIERSIVIDRPIGDVWEFVHDTSKDALWQTTLSESEKLTEGPLAVGSRVREVRHFLGLRIGTTWEVTECEPSSKSAVRSVSRCRSPALPGRARRRRDQVHRHRRA